jgi:ACS family hexuronate transporter-like MFS transporter
MSFAGTSRFMNATLSESVGPPRGPAWKWWVCGLLLLATMLNYMDRLTLNLTAKLVMQAFNLDEQDYGQLESAFAVAFAMGSITFGWLADRINVRWLYPAALLAWSLAGFSTGVVESFGQLIACRFFLGLFEGSNWPCALRTTQRILPPAQRPMGNSILQSGAAVGAVVTPLLVRFLVTDGDSWRAVFLVVGGVGVTWVFLWLPSVRSADLQLPQRGTGPTLLPVVGWILLVFGIDLIFHLQGGRLALPTWLSGSWGNAEIALPNLRSELPWLPPLSKAVVTALGVGGVFVWLRHATRDDTALPRATFYRRYWVLVTVVVSINVTWHFLRAWLPLFLQNKHGYTLGEASDFFTAYYIATDLGSLSAGFLSLMLLRRSWTIFGSRTIVFLGFALLALLSVVVPALESGFWLVAVLLVVGYGSLGVFPIYYAFSQELTTRHQGKVTGCLGCSTWLVMSLLHELVGDRVKETQSYAEALALAGVAPLVGLAALLLLWRPDKAAG